MSFGSVSGGSELNQACQSDLGAGEALEQIILSAITQHLQDK